MKTFSIKEALSFGWREFKVRPWFFVGVFVVVIAISFAFSFVVDAVGEGLGGAIVQVVAIIVQWWLTIGIISILLMVYDKRTPVFAMLFSGSWQTLWHYVLAAIVYGLVVLGGLILLIVPGIMWSIKYSFYGFLIVDKNMKPMEALKRSGVITKGHKWQLFGFFIILGLLNVLGVLVLGVGLLVSMPVTFLAAIFVYRLLEQEINREHEEPMVVEPIQE